MKYPRVKAEMKARRWRVPDIANYLGISEQAYYNRQSRPNSTFSHSEKKLLADLFKVPEDELFKEV